jgi:hypothetical protein
MDKKDKKDKKKDSKANYPDLLKRLKVLNQHQMSLNTNLKTTSTAGPTAPSKNDDITTDLSDIKTQN